MTTYPNETTPPCLTAPGAVAPVAVEAPGHSVGRRTWTVTTDSGIAVSGHLPYWDEGDPSESEVPLERLGVVLSDINHHRDVSGRFLAVEVPARDGEPMRTGEQVPVFCGAIDCDPYAPASEWRVPVFNFCLVDDYRVTALDPDGVAELAAVLREQADVLDNQVRPALAEARRDWAENSSTPLTE
ncbi:hypothetical protein OG900_20490 [Streptomyces sp. NBC_00433]